MKRQHERQTVHRWFVGLFAVFMRHIRRTLYLLGRRSFDLLDDAMIHTEVLPETPSALPNDESPSTDTSQPAQSTADDVLLQAEAILFVAAEPVDYATLVRALLLDEALMPSVVRDLRARWSERGIRLLARDLVREQSRAESLGRPILYGTTPQFLHVFGLESLGDLPPFVGEGLGDLNEQD